MSHKTPHSFPIFLRGMQGVHLRHLCAKEVARCQGILKDPEAPREWKADAAIMEKVLLGLMKELADAAQRGVTFDESLQRTPIVGESPISSPRLDRSSRMYYHLTELIFKYMTIHSVATEQDKRASEGSRHRRTYAWHLS